MCLNTRFEKWARRNANEKEPYLVEGIWGKLSKENISGSQSVSQPGEEQKKSFISDHIQRAKHKSNSKTQEETKESEYS